MDGILLYVVGPSGAGKDSLISRVRPAWQGAQPGGRRVRFARRYVTRPADCPGEEHYPVSPAGFAALKMVGEFCLDWYSHGLCYGIGREVGQWLGQGDLVILNGSRSYLPQAEKIFPCLRPVLVSVKREVLRTRLEARGRENALEIEERLSLAARPLETAKEVIVIDNSSSLDLAVGEFGRVIQRLSAAASWKEYCPERAARQFVQAR